MAVRNFWIEAHIDGRKTTLTGGPRAKDGGFRLTIYQRSKGTITTAFTVTGVVRADGRLLTVITDDGHTDASRVTDR